MYCYLRILYLTLADFAKRSRVTRKHRIMKREQSDSEHKRCAANWKALVFRMENVNLPQTVSEFGPTCNFHFCKASRTDFGGSGGTEGGYWGHLGAVFEASGAVLEMAGGAW